ncbi:MAG: response regulator transcription factor [Alphaproteobacteria bacterium]|nr:response regulator transcription factor [Alphaproteobacteria bacterium]
MAMIGVLCVDDNPMIADALSARLALEPDMALVGRLSDASTLLDTVGRVNPDIVLLDVDMPGRDPFDAVDELRTREPMVRVVMFSGHLRGELVDRAVEAGAWGYVSKNEGTEAIIDAIRRAAAGEFVMVPDISAE